MPVYVKDIMSKPLTIDLNKSIYQAGKLMKKTRRDCVIVTKNNHPVGIVTDSDLIKKIIAKNIKPSSLKLKDIMSKPLVTIDENQTMLDASRKMKKINIKRLVVVRKGKLAGIISLSDIARTSPEMLDLLEYKIKMKEFMPSIEEEFTSGICEVCGNYSEDLKYMNEQWLCESCREEVG